MASTDGVELAVYDLPGPEPVPGPGRGPGRPTLLYSHATGFHGHVWLPIARRLADRYHGIAFDHRGHGDSSRPSGDTVDWRSYGEDCAAVVAALGLRRPFGLGHSKGGVALLMCELARPGTFRALVVYEPVIYPPAPAAPRPDMADNTRRRRTSFASYEDAMANFSSKPPMDVCTPEALDAYVRYGFAEQPDGRVVLKCHPEHEAATYEGSVRHTLWNELGALRCPVLVLAGEPTDGGWAQLAPEVVARIPGARLQRLPHLGHFGPLQDPDAIAQAAAAFFADVEVAAPS